MTASQLRLRASMCKLAEDAAQRGMLDLARIYSVQAIIIGRATYRFKESYLADETGENARHRRDDGNT